MTLPNYISNFIDDFWKYNFGDFGTFCDWTKYTIGSSQTPFDFTPIINWFVLFVVFALVIYVLLLRNHKVLRVLSKHFLTTLSFVVWLCGVFIYIVGFVDVGVNGISVVPRAIIASFRMFIVNNELARIPEFLRQDALYMTFFSITHFVAAFISFLFIFRLVGYKMRASWRMKTHRIFRAKGHATHLFWGVNNASCLMAESIRSNSQHEKDTIIFVDVDKEPENDTQRKATLSFITNVITINNSEIERLDNIDALVDHCYSVPIEPPKEGEKIDFWRLLGLNNIRKILKKSECIHIYILSDDEMDNMAHALNMLNDNTLCKLANNKKTPQECTIHIHARKDANNEIFDHYSQYNVSSQNIRIKLVDSAYIAVEDLKRENMPQPVECVMGRMTKAGSQVKFGLVDSVPFNSLVIGFGETGQEAFKFLYEFSALLDKNEQKIPFKCTVIDEHMDKISGLVHHKLHKIIEAQELLLIQDRVNTKSYWDRLTSMLPQLDYVVVTINNDDEGLSCAVNLFKYALQVKSNNDPKLHIVLRCYNSNNVARMDKVANSLNSNVDTSLVQMYIFGKAKEIYSNDTILMEHTLNEAQNFHWVYENKKLATAQEQWKNDFVESTEGVSAIDKTIAKAKDNGQILTRFHAIYDINRRISQDIANAQHQRTKLMLMELCKDQNGRLNELYQIVNTRKKTTTSYASDNQDAKRLLMNLAKVEHERWMAAHKLMGITYGPKTDMTKKQHENMVGLNELYQIVNTRKEKTTSYASDNQDAKRLLMNLAKVEHERWIAAHKLMGFTHGPKTDMTKKQHENMVGWNELNEITRSYDCNVIDTTIKLKYNKENKKHEN